MPELPEAEVAARQIRDRLSGAVIRESWVGRGDIIREGAETLPWYCGSRLTTVTRYGKSVVLALHRKGEQRFLVAELGMTGLLLFPSVRPKHPQHTHLVLFLDQAQEPELRYWNPRRFGRICLLDQPGLDRYVGRRFGLDPLTMTPEDFRALLAQRRRRLKPFLMHQQAIAGLGNIYANEILFRASLHPHRLTSSLRQRSIDELYRVMRDVLTAAIASGGSSVRDFYAPDGTEGRYKLQHRVYAKEGLPCPNACGSRIARLRGERSSFYCPRCQRRR